MSFDYDVAVIGAGPGGYIAAIRCARHGLSTALIERADLGGTCLNRGCIPTKALLHGANLYEDLGTSEDLGILATGLRLDYARLAAFRDKQVLKLRRGIGSLLKSHGVSVMKGEGQLLDPHTVSVDGNRLTVRNIILATGSAPAKPGIHGIEHAVTSDDVLLWDSLSASVGIIGGGVIGMEFASLFSMAGCEVHVLEAQPCILPGMDRELADLVSARMQSHHVNILCDVRVEAISQDRTIDYLKAGARHSLKVDQVVVCIGRKPSTSGLGLEQAGVALNKGYVQVNERQATSLPHIYAIGDITGKAQLAHAASAQGLAAADQCAGVDSRVNDRQIPSCVYTNPELATIGYTEAEALKLGRQIKTGVFKVAGNGRSLTMNQSEGFCKLVTDARSGEILGAQLAGPHATELVSQIAVAMRCEGTVEELAATVFPHPSISEIVMEAALDVLGQSCHKSPRE